MGDSWQKILVAFVIVSLIIPPGLNNFSDDPSLQIQDAFAVPSSIPNNGKTVDDVVHFLIQFDEIPNATQKKNILNGMGVNLGTYVSENTYIASSNIPDLSSKIPEHAKAYGVRSIIELDSSVKLSDNLKVDSVDDIGFWAKIGENQVVVTIYLHGDVDVTDGEDLVEELGGEVLSVIPSIPAILAVFNFDVISEISQYDIVQYVDIAEIALGPHNGQARVAANIAPVNIAPFSLTGSGVTALVYDVGTIDTFHPDFGARVIELDGDVTVVPGDHATHVGGTLGGDGSNSNGNDSRGVGFPNGGSAGQWAGMAPAVSIRSFSTTGFAADFYNGNGGDLNADFTTAMNSGIDLATMSLGNNVLNNFPCAQLGDYTSTAILIDNIVTGSINNQQLIYFESAGNERGAANTCTNASPFFTISSPATAKNSIAVGAINSNDNSITPFTSFGPTDDGRIKPDVVAPGCRSFINQGITSPSFTDTDNDGFLDAGETRQNYVVKCGTSMATPATAGLGALITEQWKTFNGAASAPLPHTMKAILVHTATDLDDAGPDYRTGWGAIDGVTAVNLVIDDDTENIITVGAVDDTDTDTYTFDSDGLASPRITLVWDDPAATQLAATTLINDLDLRIEDPDGTVFQPFLLDPTNPDTPATNGNDATNNVEMVIGTAKAGTWEVTVSGTSVPSGPQQYTLIVPIDNLPPVADANGPYSGPEGTDIDLDGTGSSDPDGDPITYEWDFDNDGFFDDATGATPTYTNVGDEKVVTIKLKVTDDSGASDVDETTLTVTNVAPTIDSLNEDGPINEGQTVTVDGTASDPGWEDDLSATIDWDDGNGEQNMTEDSEENVRPDATLAFSSSLKYGDDGVFNTEVCVEDGDGGEDCNDLDITVNNVAPSAVIDETSTVLFNGMNVFLATIGEDIDFSGNSVDPGSDDLTIAWDWDDGPPSPDVSTEYLVNPPGSDPTKSPTNQPRDVTDDKTHAFADACLYDITLTSDDDDSDHGEDSAKVIIVGDAEEARSAGYWQQQVQFTQQNKKNANFESETLLCYLDIIKVMSTIFDANEDLSSLQDARDTLKVGKKTTDHDQLLRQILAGWLNFADGSVALDDLVDTNADTFPDTVFSDVLTDAEAVFLSPTSTEPELLEQIAILDSVNNMDES